MWRKRETGEMSFWKAFSLKYAHGRVNFSKKIGIAYFGVTIEMACSSRTVLRYALTLLWEARLPTPNKSFHSPPRPMSAKSDLSFPIILSTVPAANLDGHGHGSGRLDPNKGQDGMCTLVFPELSFHTRKRAISLGVAL